MKQGWPSQVAENLQPFKSWQELPLEESCLLWEIQVIILATESAKTKP